MRLALMSFLIKMDSTERKKKSKRKDSERNLSKRETDRKDATVFRKKERKKERKRP
jgi:hypothetical protein